MYSDEVMNCRTFSLTDMDESFWEKVLLIERHHSSGLGGPGCLWIVTSEPKSYFIGFEGFEFSEYRLELFHPIFKRKKNCKDYDHPFVAEDHGWKYFPRRRILIREEFYEAFMKVYEEEAKVRIYVHVPDAAGKALGFKGEMERLNYKGTVKVWIEHMRGQIDSK